MKATIQIMVAGLLMAGLAVCATPAKSTRPVETLKLRGGELSIARSKGSPVLFKPGRRARRASYKTYEFRNKQFRKHLGDPKTLDSATVQVVILGKSMRKYHPKKGMPAPRGGFRFTTYRVKILKVTKVKRKSAPKR